MNEPTNDDDMRLRPTHYTLELWPNLETLRFKGRARIRLEVPADTEDMRLDAVDLHIDECRVVEGASGGEVTWSVKGGKLIVGYSAATHESAATDKTVELDIGFDGEINDQMAGFYRSRYEIDGDERFLAVTQFEERDARRAFPCVDEPWAKAVFTITIHVMGDDLAISNTAAASIEPEAGGQVFRFEPTPPMSTYLVFFAVGPFDVRSDDEGRTPVRVAVSPGKGIYATESLVYARQSLDFLESFTGVAYPLSKLDSIGVTDFAFGAMENFGAICYRENLVLTYPDTTTRREKESMMGVAAHEIAHMWFGDLVSPAAWRYVWLNEAFATYVGNLTTSHAYPEWRVMEQFVTGAIATAMDRDALPRSVPIELEADGIEIDPSTAPIVYSKGASVLRMLHGFYGDDAFRGAVWAFLDQYRFAAANTEQFIASFGARLADGQTETERKTTSEMLQRWVRTPGMPLVRVSRHGQTLSLRQERFTVTGMTGQPTNWIVPVTGIVGAGDSQSALRVMLSESEGTVDVPSDARWVKLNAEQAGYYRMFYEDDDAWEALGAAALAGELEPIERYGLVSDMAAFVAAGLVRLPRFLSFLSRYYRNEQSYIVTVAIASALSSFYTLLGDEAIAEAGRALLSPWTETLLGTPRADEPYQNVLLREPVLWALFTFGDATVATALRRLAADIRAGEAVHPDWFSLATRAAVAVEKGAGEWVRNELGRSGVSEARKVQLIRALAAAQDRDTLEAHLEYAINSIPDRNRTHFVRAAAENRHAFDLLWPWFTRHFERLSTVHPYHLGSTLVAAVAVGGIGREEEVTAFLDRYRSGTPRVDGGVIEMAIDRLYAHRALREREGGA